MGVQFHTKDLDYTSEDARSGKMSPNAWLATKTWIVWYKRSSLDALELVWRQDPRKVFLKCEPRISADAIKLLALPLSRNNFDLDVDTSQTEVSIRLSPDMRLRPYPLLHFNTLSVRYRLSGAYGTVDIVGRDGSICGSMGVDAPVSARYHESFEFIILSECRYGVSALFALDRQEGNRWLEADPDLFDLYWVMLIVWDGGIAERRGLGQIYQSKIMKSLPPGPVWKEILLG